MAECEHNSFYAKVNVNRIIPDEGGPVQGYSADITVNCDQCGQQFGFPGVPSGISEHRPTCSIDGLELRVPLCIGEIWQESGVIEMSGERN